MAQPKIKSTAIDVGTGPGQIPVVNGSGVLTLPSRSITIGASTKSVDWSADVTWTLADIGAADASVVGDIGAALDAINGEVV